MGRLAWLGWIAALASACAVGTQGDPFGGGVTGNPQDDDDAEVSSSTNDTDPLSTISETLETSAAPTTSGVVSDTDASSSSTGNGSESGEGTSSSGGDTSSSSGDGSSSTGAEEVAMCASSDTLSACPVGGSNSQPYTGEMQCTSDMTYTNPEVYDMFVVDVSAGQCVSVSVDNTGGNADIMAYVVDASEAYYGLEADYTELDDEMACSVTPWNGYACPSQGVTAASAGTITIAVGQWGLTPDCTNDAPYTLSVAIDGEDVDLSDALALDDYVVDPLACP